MEGGELERDEMKKALEPQLLTRSNSSGIGIEGVDLLGKSRVRPKVLEVAVPGRIERT